MLYELAPEPPEPGSLLESVFMLMAKKRQEIRFLETRFLAESAILSEQENADAFREAYRDYSDAIFPYLARDREEEARKAKKVMHDWAAQKALRVRPIWRPHEVRGVVSRMRRAAEKIKSQESRRRGVRI